MPGTPLPDQQAALWREATEHPFLAAVRDGTVAEQHVPAVLRQEAAFWDMALPREPQG